MSKIKKSIAIIAIVIICICTFPITSKAASFSLSVTNQNLEVGNTATLTLVADSCGGRFKLESSDTSIVSIDGGLTPWVEKETYSTTIRAKKAGKATITLTATDVSTSGGNPTPLEGTKTVTITVKDPAPPNNGGGNSGSGDNSLKSITVAGKKYPNPSTDFTINVDSGVTSVDISAEASSGSAKISGTGKKELSTGTNTVTITVTAENGAKKTYSVRIRRLADTTNQTPNKIDNQNNNQEPEEPDTQEEPQEPELLRLTYLLIEDVELTPEFSSEVFEYTANVINKEELEIVKVVNKEDAIVEITGDKDLIDGENIVTIKLSKDRRRSRI